MDKVFGVCHSVAVEVGGIKIPVPVFILEGASKEFMLGRLWDRWVHAQQANRQDGSLYISIMSLDDRKKATFCAVADCTDCERDRVRILRLEDDAKQVLARVLATVERSEVMQGGARWSR